MTKANDPSSNGMLKEPRLLFAADGPLASRKPGYRERPEQIDLADAVEECFESKSVLLADAPTGTGKSLGYLAPAILRAAQRGEKVVVTTATLALQAQLLTEDLPPLRSAAAELLGYPEEEGVSFSVMKGRRNFLCTKRHLETLMAGTVFDTELITNLDRWAAETETGDREDLPFAMPVSAWAEIASDGDDCSPRTCVYREGCHYYAHRDEAEEADILVVNHALLLANAASYGSIFDTKNRHLIIDEAHRLEEIMAEAFGARVSYARILYVTRQARKRCEGAHASTDTAEMAAEMFFEELSGETTRLHQSPPKAYGKLVEALRDLRSVLAHAAHEEANLLQGMVGRLRKDLEMFYGKPDDDYAYAVVAGRGRGRSANAKTYPELKSWLVETADVFRDEVLETATEGRNGGTDEEEEEGVSRTVSEFAGDEVFDYGSRVLIYAESGSDEMPAPTYGKADEFARGCVRRTEELVGLSSGRALVILSTKRAVSVFRETFKSPYPVRYQGDDAPGRLVKWLRETKNGVLVGTASFREGIDVAGEALSLVVMDKAPFAPPDDPVTSKLREKAGDAAFRDIFLPKAQVAMRQGAGRLMRRPDDRGVIAILDPRISAKGWGKSILSSLPPAPRTTEMADVARFFGTV